MTNQPEERTRKQFIVRWTVATLVGGAIGVGVALTAGSRILQIITYHWLSALVVSTSMFGFFVGLVQWRIALKGKMSWQWWVVAAIFTVIIWGIAINTSLLKLPIITHYDRSKSHTHPEIIMEIVGAKIPLSIAVYLLVGIATGLPQWLILRRQFMQAYRWLLGTIAASLAWLLLLLSWTVIGADNMSGAFVLFFVLTPVTYASITGYVLFDVLKRAKTNNVSE